MSSKDSAAKRHDLLIAASTIGCHASSGKGGFRQRDLKRMLQFSGSWAYPEFDEGGVPVENTQIRRYLDGLVSEGFARRNARGDQPKYSLTRIGLIELVSTMVDRGFFYNKEEFFYLYFIVRDYQYGLKRVIEREGAKLSYATRLELEELFNSKAVVKRQLYYARREVKKSKKRISDQKELAAFVSQSVRNELPFDELVSLVDQRFPYCFNTALPFTQFISNLTQKQIIWELTNGCLKRCEHIWKPALEALELHVAQLERLLEKETG